MSLLTLSIISVISVCLFGLSALNLNGNAIEAQDKIQIFFEIRISSQVSLQVKTEENLS